MFRTTLAALAISALVTTTTTAASKSIVPEIDFRAHCSKNLFVEICYSSEAHSHANLVTIWPKLSTEDKAYCADGAKSYGQLLACAKIKTDATE